MKWWPFKKKSKRTEWKQAPDDQGDGTKLTEESLVHILEHCKKKKEEFSNMQNSIFENIISELLSLRDFHKSEFENNQKLKDKNRELKRDMRFFEAQVKDLKKTYKEHKETIHQLKQELAWWESSEKGKK